MWAMPDKTLNERILEIARGEIGVHETPGPESTARIIEYHACTSLRATKDEIAWCSSFVNWVMKRAGIKGTNSAAARSWLSWGVPCNPVPGCVVVLKRGTYPSGHVGFFIERRSPGGWVWVLGGNQSDQVKVSAYQEADVLGYRTVEKI
jgi:uncharacterized protein (TIGR02594 family)